MAEYIERDLTVQKILEVGIANYQGQYPNIGMVHAANIVKYMPAADVAPVVHAKWLINTDEFTPKKRCTNCGYNKPIAAGERLREEPEKYCPNCGAKMED